MPPPITDDDSTTLAAIRQMISEFVEERDWKQFHSPKNLSMALTIEAGELMEHFQWIDAAESRQPSTEKRVQIGEELADVLCYAFSIANELNIDVASTMNRKMELNRQKYPAAEFRGRYGPEDTTGKLGPTP